MHQLEVLEKLYAGHLAPQDAMAALSPPIDFRALKKARFIKLRIVAREEGLFPNLLLRLLFLCPFPVVLLRIAVRFAPKKMFDSLSEEFGDFQAMGPKELYRLIRYARGTTVRIDTDDALVSIKIR
ncbi:MAG: hypothetical protein EA374_07375 [Acholeplasmatales bacterium]|nr:MAG: hypothetical protein EA374_07375 [Acholeplasmatales bacterium]